jgi:hypothetical protein
MTTPPNPDPGPDDAPPAKVSVPIRIGDGIWTHDEYAKVDPENADQWDARLWRDQP